MDAWSAAGVGTDPIATDRFRFLWRTHVMGKLRGARERDAAERLLALVCAFLAQPPEARSADVADEIVPETIFYTVAAAHGPSVAAQVVKAYRTEGIDPELRARIADGRAAAAASLEHRRATQPRAPSRARHRSRSDRPEHSRSQAMVC